MRNRPYVPVWLPLAVLIAAVLAGCNREENAGPAKSAPPVTTVKTAIVQQRDLARTVDLTGEVVAGTSVTISATVEGPISLAEKRTLLDWSGNFRARSFRRQFNCMKIHMRRQVGIPDFFQR